MAKFRAILGDLSGDLAGMQFQRGRNGPVCRKKPSHTQRPPDAGAAFQLGPLWANEAWIALSDAQRLDWQRWADETPRVDALGNSYRLTGRQAFMAINLRRETWGIPPLIQSPPSGGIPALLVTPTVTQNSSRVIFTFSPPQGSTGDILIIRYQLKPSGLKTYRYDRAKLLGYVTGAPFTAPFLQVAGILCHGQSYALWLQLMNSEGRLGAYIASSVTWNGT